MPPSLVPSPGSDGQNDELSRLVATLPMPAFVCAPDGRVLHFNQKALWLWGREPDADRPEERFCGPLRIFSDNGEPVPLDLSFMALTIRSGEECTGKEIIIQAPDGHCASMLAYAREIQDDAGCPAGALGMLADIGAQKKDCLVLQEELLKCRLLERKFFEYCEGEQSRVTHYLHEDLGQQLTGIALLARVLGRHLSEESHAEVGRVIELAQLTSECIGTARNLAKGSYPIELDHGGLNVALDDLAERTAAHAKVSCTILYDEAFDFDPEATVHLYRIAQELIDNAVRHAGARNIVVECKILNGIAVMVVTHDGIPLKCLINHPEGIDFDLIHARARLFGARIEIGESKAGGVVTCWLEKNPDTSDRAALSGRGFL